MQGFDAPAVFNEDFAYFYGERLGELRTEQELGLIGDVLPVRPGQRVLDLCCGTGRIARGLHRLGATVIGIDLSRELLQLAAKRDGMPPLVLGDMRALPFAEAFDYVVCWYSSFGYFDDATNRAVLAEMGRVLRPGGRLLLDLDGKDRLLSSALPTTLHSRSGDVMVEEFHFDEATSRVEAARTVVREGSVRGSSYFVRLFSEAEARRWLEESGFVEIRVLNERGTGFAPRDRRMLLRASRGWDAAARRS